MDVKAADSRVVLFVHKSMSLVSSIMKALPLDPVGSLNRFGFQVTTLL